jgi:glucose-6-phosphate 1-dehydrogenase
MVDPCDFVIFGGTGDLAVRKLLPALYLRDRDGELTADTRIIAVARAGLDEPGYRDKVQAELGRFVATELLDSEPSTASWPGCGSSAST